MNGLGFTGLSREGRDRGRAYPVLDTDERIPLCWYANKIVDAHGITRNLPPPHLSCSVMDIRSACS